MKRAREWCLGLLVAAAGCAPGEGTLQATMESEESIVDGIGPAVAGRPGGMADGWTLRYERFYINLGYFRVADEDGAAVAIPAEYAAGEQVYDLRNELGAVLFTVPATARRYGQVGFRNAATGAATRFSARIPMADRAAMMGVSTWVTGVATRSGRTVRFDWQFREGWEYSGCEGPASRPGPGTVVREGGVTPLRISIHGEHYFWQSLGESGASRFDVIANADTNTAPYQGNGDGLVTLDELDRVGLASIPAADGQFTPNGRPVTTLGDFMRWTTGTNAHIDGDGVCRGRRITP